MTPRENRLLPMSAIAAMLAVTTTIVGLAYWVGDAVAPGLAAIVGVSTTSAAVARTPDASAPLRLMAAPPTQAERTQETSAEPRLAGRATANAGR